MAKDIVDSWRKFQLTELEQQVDHFDLCKAEEIVRREKRSLIGLLIFDR